MNADKKEGVDGRKCKIRPIWVRIFKGMEPCGSPGEEGTDTRPHIFELKPHVIRDLRVRISSLPWLTVKHSSCLSMKIPMPFSISYPLAPVLSMNAERKPKRLAKRTTISPAWGQVGKERGPTEQRVITHQHPSLETLMGHHALRQFGRF